ncbi:MAG: type II toxin-antitoxin system VapC family toxin [Bryobacteraceae bacterium]
MITAVDTNILLDILVPNERFYEASADALQDAAGEGSLVIGDIVFAELCIHFETRRECDAFLESNEIRVQALTREALFLASRTWRTYRRQGGKRTRILADYLIGARAQTQATRLLSRDRGFYRKLFPSLDLHDPAGVNKGD